MGRTAAVRSAALRAIRSKPHIHKADARQAPSAPFAAFLSFLALVMHLDRRGAGTHQDIRNATISHAAGDSTY